MTGPEDIKKLLSSINVDEELEQSQKDILNTSGDELNSLNRKIRYLQNLKDLGLKPSSAFMTKVVPVLPPVFRPTYLLDSGDIATSQLNKAYRALGAVNKKMEELKSILTQRRRGKLTGTLYDGLKALHGLGNPITSVPYKGILDVIKGEEVKSGFFHDTLVRKTQEPAGRSTITLEPTYHMDEAGIPEKMAWTIYEPFLMKRLIGSGMSPIDAKTQVNEKTEFARNALEAEVLERPVLLNRSPSLHKWSIMSFRPKLVKGDSIVLNPLVCKGFNADFDGDAMTVHVPVSDAAVEESKGMFPSKHMYRHGYKNDVIVIPSQGALLGLYYMTQEKKKEKNPETYKGFEAMKDAYQQNKISLSDQVYLKESPAKLTTIGREILKREMPHGVVLPEEFNAKTLAHFIGTISSRIDASDIINKLKNLGFHYVFHHGATLGLSDLPEINTKNLLKGDVQEIEKNLPKLEEETKRQLMEQGSTLYPIIESGSRAKWRSASDMVAAPGIYMDLADRIIPLKIDQSYAKGLTPGQYFASTYGARKAEVSKSLMTAEPGDLANTLLSTMSDVIINKEDFGDEGIEMPIDHKDMVDRYTAEVIKDGGKTLLPKNTLITDQILQILNKKNINRIKVRSPLTAKNPHGISAKSFGLYEDGNLPEHGDNIGIRVSHALAEPLTQMSLKAFHTQGMTDKKKADFWDVERLLGQPREVKKAAILSPVDGMIKGIEQNEVGLYNIMVEPHKGDKKITFTSKLFLPPVIEKGQMIYKGDPLTHGNIDYRELLGIVGLKDMQLKLTKDITKTYEDLGIPIKQRYVEVVVRKLTDNAHIIDAANSGYVPGDWESVYALENYNTQNKDKPIKYDLVPTGIRTRVSYEEDWPKRLVFGQKIFKNTILEGASRGWASNIYGGSPWSAWLVGEIGQEPPQDRAP